jgi:transposase
MAHCYVPVDRDQPFLLPPDMREWLSEGHLAWFVLDVVARLDTAALHARHRNDGVGRRAYDPDMLLGLLIYAYCTGQRSSRQIERLCEVDVAYRVICANRAPDHTTIARFRQDHEPVAVGLFIDVLVLCATAGLVRVGVVAIDGTKVGADASLAANRTRAQIEAEVEAMFRQAAGVDAEQDCLFGQDRGDELPAELADPRRRGARLDAALRQLEAAAAARRADEQARAEKAARGEQPTRVRDCEEVTRREAALAVLEDELSGPDSGVARAEAALADAEAEAAQADANRTPGGKKRGRPRSTAKGAKVARAVARRDNAVRIAERRRRHAQARLAKAKARAAAQAATRSGSAGEPRVNVTDPGSRIMKTAAGWIQGYNAQAAVNDAGIVLAATVTQDHNDLAQCVPMMAATQDNLITAGVDEQIGTMLFDAGYCSEDNLCASGPDRLIATTKSWKLRAQAKQQGFLTGPPPAGATAVEAMEHRLQTADGSALYAKRSTTVEPLFGQHKDGRGFRRFVRRGLSAVDAEWQLINATHNLLKMFRAGVNFT